MAAPSPLLDLLDQPTRDALTWRSMVAANIEEGHPALMRLQRLLQITASWPDSAFKTRLLDSARAQAKAARRRLSSNPKLAHYYFQRMEQRSMLEAMQQPIEVIEQRLALLQHPNKKHPRLTAAQKLAAVQAQVDAIRPWTPEDQERVRRERNAELVRRGEPDLAAWCAARKEPVYAPRERGAGAVAQRRDWHLHLRDYKRAVQETQAEELAKSRAFAAAEAQLPDVVADNSAPKRMRGVDFQRLTAPEKVLHDHLLLAHWGVPIPRASVHMQGHIPLHRRPGLR